MASPTSRTLALLRADGYLAAVVEKYVAQRQIHIDLFGFGDVLAVHPKRREFVIVQTTTASNLASRITKARGRPELVLWLQAGGRALFHGWAQRSGHWSAKVIEITAGDLEPVVLARPPRQRRKSRWQPRNLFDT